MGLCGDYIFSGHTMIFAVSYLTVRDYSPRKLFLLPWASLALSTAGVVMLLLGRGHYSIDVLLAYYVTTRVWWFYHLIADSPSLRTLGARSFLGGGKYLRQGIPDQSQEMSRKIWTIYFHQK